MHQASFEIAAAGRHVSDFPAQLDANMPALAAAGIDDGTGSAEQARIIQLLVERVEIGPEGADIRLRVSGLANIVGELGAVRAAASGVAA